MAETSSEQNRYLDFFDEILVFSYAYEWQKRSNNAIDTLIELRNSIEDEIQKNEALNCILNAQKKRYAVFRILNGLHGSVKKGIRPKAISARNNWHNYPESLNGFELDIGHQTQFKAIINLIVSVISRLRHALPDELMPFVTLEQVEVILVSELKYGGFVSIPIHKQLMATQIHRHLAMMFSDQIKADEEFVYFEKVAKEYCKKALSEFFDGWTSDEVNKLIRKYFDKAKSIQLEIDSCYVWPQICFSSVDYNDLLLWYRTLNELGIIEDASYMGEKRRSDDLPSPMEDIHRVEGDYRRFSPERSVTRFLYDSAKTQVVIDRDILQNHFVMVFPYDKPLSELDNKLKIYKRCICNRVYKYGADHGYDSEYEEIAHDLTSQRDLRIKTERLVIKNVSSVMKHICLLLLLQMERSGAYSNKLKKHMVHDVYNLVKSFGFDYGLDTIATERKRISIEMNKVVQQLKIQM